MSDYKSAVVGGKLNLKGKKKKRKAAAAPAFVELAARGPRRSAPPPRARDRPPPQAPAESSEPARDGEGHLTDAERRHKKRFLEKRKGEVEKSVEASHRSRVDEFNDKLASLTEHNDIPRISAAGNG